MANIYDMTDTWNDAGTTFTAIKMNVTDTNSAAGSLLMDLLLDGSSKFSVGKSGVARQAALDIGAAAANFAQNTGEIWARSDSSYSADNGIRLLARGFKAQSNDYFGFASSTSLASGADVLLYRDAAGTLAQRNSTNAQTFNIYNTFTDASNYERGFMKWNSNVLEIGTEAAGTGTARNVVLNGANRVSKISDVSSGTDTAYETAINAIIDALEAHGLAATT